jgi:heme-degrading monooxygenase HmoA
MIARTWCGATRSTDAETYSAYVAETGLAAYRSTPGNRGAWLFYRIEGERAVFLALSMWETLDSIRAFAGDDVTKAVFYPEDDRFLVDREVLAYHWKVVE